ncbi:hypothetical protein [Psychrobacter faecalis]|uniref:hypothetical protein n=1 Tax=Psychrobacter faecalis TaxID=180588 RepID=UPI0019186D1F|nr:hypothetical protein [Psychrobacter faecalis]
MLFLSYYKYANQLIVDNSQSFFSRPITQACNIYSARKFFGVPDGAYLYTPNTPNQIMVNFQLEPSRISTQHLIQRIEQGPESSYLLYKQSEQTLRKTGPAKMSIVSQRILNSIDYNRVCKQRRSNFIRLNDNLSEINLLTNLIGNELDIINKNVTPMIYPLVIKNGSLLRKYLIDNKIFVAKYWEDVLSNELRSDIEEFYTENLIPLPIDQRYNSSDMQRIIDAILSFYN